MLRVGLGIGLGRTGPRRDGGSVPVLTTYYLLLTTYYLLLATYDLQLTTHNLLLTTYYLQLTTYDLPVRGATAVVRRPAVGRRAARTVWRVVRASCTEL